MAEVKKAIEILPPEITTCPLCNLAVPSGATFCSNCNASTGAQTALTAGAPIMPPANAQLYVPQGAPTVFGQMTQMFGLHPITTFATIAVDTMLFGEEAATLGVGWLISVPVAFFLGVGVAFCQRYMFRDEWGAAFGKAVIVALLTAIPTSIPTMLLLPSGALGIIKTVRGKK
ncbi:MAG TPA: hypothetical protein VIW80_02235 [Pyrinomonadaceae bacterium]|jgi:hypothetical protein